MVKAIFAASVLTQEHINGSRDEAKRDLVWNSFYVSCRISVSALLPGIKAASFMGWF